MRNHLASLLALTALAGLVLADLPAATASTPVFSCDLTQSAGPSPTYGGSCAAGAVPVGVSDVCGTVGGLAPPPASGALASACAAGLGVATGGLGTALWAGSWTTACHQSGNTQTCSITSGSGLGPLRPGIVVVCVYYSDGSAVWVVFAYATA